MGGVLYDLCSFHISWSFAYTPHVVHAFFQSVTLTVPTAINVWWHGVATTLVFSLPLRRLSILAWLAPTIFQRTNKVERFDEDFFFFFFVLICLLRFFSFTRDTYM